MKNPRLGKVLAVCCLALVATVATAQEEEAAPIMPLELYACYFNEGKTMDDLMAVTEAWNAWMDEKGRTEYWAWVLVPQFHGADITFDVGWAGMWQSGASWAESTKFWLAEGDEHRQSFDDVVDCRQHSLFAMMTIRQTASAGQPGPVSFTNCSIREGNTVDDVVGAVRQWVAHEEEQGIGAGHFLLFNTHGENADADYTFKWISGGSYDAFGKAFDNMAGGSWAKSMELFDERLDCDSARVYHGMPVRQGQMTE